MKVRLRVPIPGKIFLYHARQARPHEELPDDAGSIRELMTTIARQLGASERRRRRQITVTKDEDLKLLRRKLLRVLKVRKRGAAAAAASVQVAQWAEERNALRTAAFFVEAATAFDPNDAKLANWAGKLAMRRADYEAADGWFRKGIDLGQRSQDWESVAIGWSGLGAITRNSGGDADDAAAHHMRSLAIARLHGLATEEAEGFHALAVLAFDQHRYHEGVTYARNALDIYGGDRGRIVILANNLAWQWMDKDHTYGRVLPIFRECARSDENPAHQVVMLGNLARAAAGAGDWQNFESAEYRLLSTLPQAQHSEGHADGLLELAKGALMLGLREKAHLYAQQAHVAAKRRREAKLEKQTLAFMEHADTRAATSSQTAPRVASKPEEQRMDDLAMELVLALR
jgi:tetratricopeptide (TPR) repeat protein